MHEDITVVAQADVSKILAAANIRSSWFDIQGQKSYLFYILGAEDASMKKPEPALPEGQTEWSNEVKERRAKL